MESFKEWKASKINESATRIRLDETHFKDLVEGKEVEIEGVKMILADIGFDNMIKIIQHATSRWDK